MMGRSKKDAPLQEVFEDVAPDEDDFADAELDDLGFDEEEFPEEDIDAFCKRIESEETCNPDDDFDVGLGDFTDDLDFD